MLSYDAFDSHLHADETDDRQQQIAYDLDRSASRLRAYDRCVALADGSVEQVAYWEAAIAEERERLLGLRRLLSVGEEDQAAQERSPRPKAR